MTGERWLSDEQYDELLTVVYESNIPSPAAGAVLNLIREHRQLLAERAETARLRALAREAVAVLESVNLGNRVPNPTAARLRAALAEVPGDA